MFVWSCKLFHQKDINFLQAQGLLMNKALRNTKKLTRNGMTVPFDQEIFS
jgi:hypothetical protein